MPRTSGQAASAIALVAVGTAAASYTYHRILVLRRKLVQCEERRQAERTGRIRAEVKLRKALKQQSAPTARQDPSDDSASQQNHDMAIHCIGTVVSPFTKRMGTPRQGGLVPSSRGFIQFSSSSAKKTFPMESVDGMDQYSHVWIIFGFHANTDLKGSPKTKVQPPRAPCKVGNLATRSPHRPNPIGLSLVKMEHIDVRQRRIHVSALDLVHGTPVFDVKPCVPWDIPGYYENGPGLQVPPWVSQDDAIPQVVFTEEADQSLQKAVEHNQLQPLYTRKNNGYEAAKKTLLEILAQDPRATHKRQTVMKTAYKIVFGATQIEFIVPTAGMVQVTSVDPVEFGSSTYVDGVPLASENETNQIDGNCRETK